MLNKHSCTLLFGASTDDDSIAVIAERIYLAGNDLTGSVPKELFLLTNLGKSYSTHEDALEVFRF